jgi:hypothetical protein
MHSEEGTAAPKTTLDGFRRRIDYRVEPPRALSREEWQRLSAVERGAYDDARLHWFGSGMWIKTPHVVNVMRTVRADLRTSDALTVGESGVVLTGPAHIGKTTALWKMALLVEQRVAKADPDYRASGVVPVVYIEVPPNATPKTMAAQIVEFFGTPYNFRTCNQQQVLRMAIGLLAAHRTQVLIIDELQMLRLDGRTGDAAINTLKILMNSTGTVMVFAGIDLLAELSSRAAEQIVARCEVLTMTPFSAASDVGRGAWAALVSEFGKEMNLLGAQPNHLLPWADKLLIHTGGSIGGLRRTLSRAMTSAIDEREGDESETITESILFGFDGSSASEGPARSRRQSGRRVA